MYHPLPPAQEYDGDVGDNIPYYLHIGQNGTTGLSVAYFNPNIHWRETYNCDIQPGGVISATASHEMGHTVRLEHNPQPLNTVMFPGHGQCGGASGYGYEPGDSDIAALYDAQWTTHVEHGSVPTIIKPPSGSA